MSLSPVAEGQRPDLRLVFPALAAWLTALLTLGVSAGTALCVGGLTAVAAVAVLWIGRRHRPWKSVVAGLLVCSAAASVAVGLRLAAVADGPLPHLAHEGAEVTLEITVTGDPEVRPREVSGSEVRRYVLVRGRAEVVDDGDERVQVRSPVLLIAAGEGWDDLLPSQRVRARGELGQPRHGELLAAVFFVHGSPDVISAPSRVQHVAGEIRAGLRAAVHPLPAEERGLLPGLVVGDTSQMVARVKEDFLASGLTHLTAVSGTNVSIVLVAVLGLARVVGLGPRLAPLLAGAGVLGFAVVARPSPSVLRATVMGLIAVAALATGRQRQALPALGVAVLGLVLFEPRLARSYGFALSVLATAGLLVLTPAWSERMGGRVPRGLAEALAVPVAAQVTCLPVVVMLSGRISLVAIPANLIVAPAVAPATILGVLAAVAAPVFMPLARLFARLGGLAASWIIEVAHVAAALPYATLPWPPGLLGAGAAVAVLVGIAVVRAPLRRTVAVCAVGALLAALGLRTAAPTWPPQSWLLVQCDVGQGDAMVLAAGDHAAVVVDAGPDPRRVDDCLRRLHIRQVSLVVLTHWHADHVAGLPGVLRGREIGGFLTLPLPSRDDVAVPAWLRKADAPVRQAYAGQRWRIGTLRLDVLGPPGRMRRQVGGSGEESAENNASVVLRARWPGLTALLTGDIEPEAQRALLRTAPLEVDVLKVPHHGSAGQSPEFLAAVDPRLSIVSVGADNEYDHPSSSTLRLLRRLGSRTYRTDRNGAVAVVRRNGGLMVVAREAPL